MIFKKPQKLLPLTPDQHLVKKPPPLAQITPNFLIFYGLSHSTTLKMKNVVFFRAGPNGPSTHTHFWHKNSAIPPPSSNFIVKRWPFDMKSIRSEGCSI